MNLHSLLTLWISLAFAVHLFSCDAGVSWGGVPSNADETLNIENNIIPPDWIGTWEEAVDTTQPYFANSEHRITFLASDSFNIEIQRSTDAVAADDPCGFEWTDHASGTVVDRDSLITQVAPQSSDDVLLFRGSFTDSLYTQPVPNCQGENTFERLFSVSRKAANTLAITFYHIDQGETWETVIDVMKAKE